jgi:MerR family transcriptional regulator, light-induced transcriptional regulator
MSIFDDTPLYNLKAVIQETGLKPDTLRAWERRYGLPEPDRTSGGHRLYSQRDIEVLKWLIARQDEGLSISRAVDLWRTLNSEGQDPLTMREYSGDLRKHTLQTIVSGGESLNDLRAAWIEACLAFDGQQAEGLLAQAFALYPPEVVCFEVLQKGLSQIGSGWYRGEFTVQQEHFTSSLAMRRLEALVAAAPPPTRQGRVLIGCPPGEDHTFSPLLLTALLRRQGYDVVYLGANVPVEQLEHTIATARPDLVVMVAQQLHTAATLLDTAQLLRRLHILLAFGGRIFNELPWLYKRIPGVYLGDDLSEGSNQIAALIGTRQPIHRPEPAADVYQQAILLFRDRRRDIEAQVWNKLEHSPISPSNLSVANLNFGRNIEAALCLGSMEAISPELAWIRGLLINLRLSDQVLFQYIQVYRDAVENSLHLQGHLITEWLDTILETGINPLLSH